MSEQFLDLHGKDAKMNSQKKVLITSLDALLASSALPSISFIKADVEGYERELLLGAEETIRRFHPKLSICTYHLPDDWRVIPGIIARLFSFTFLLPL